MGYRKVKSMEQIVYIIKHSVSAWIEWHDAKCWAKEYHPSWVVIAQRAESKEVREIYRSKIISAYRGE